jgi:hypothetical protein
MQTNAAPEREIVTTPRYRARLRKGLFAGAFAIVPAAVGTGIGTLARSRRAGALAGGIAAGVLVLARWQLRRLFTDEATYKIEKRFGALELRAYEPYVIVRTVIEEADFLAAQQIANDRFDRYLDPNGIKMIAPYEMSRDGAGHAMAFIMPPGRSVASLPHPEDARIRVMVVPRRRIAALPYRGAYKADAIAERERELMRLVAERGLSAKGRPMFAGFDSPGRLPLIRKNELWVEIN